MPVSPRITPYSTVRYHGANDHNHDHRYKKRITLDLDLGCIYMQDQLYPAQVWIRNTLRYR